MPPTQEQIDQFRRAFEREFKHKPKTYPIPRQEGPLRQFDQEMRCASKGCGAPTYFKLKGRPKCIIHALRSMNEMLVEAGIEK